MSIGTGLSVRDINCIHEIFKKYPSVKSVFLFGSRAKGNFKKGSDVDLVILNSEVKTNDLLQLKNDFEESSLPYKIDLIDFKDLNHPEMKAHIERAGIEFYKK